MKRYFPDCFSPPLPGHARRGKHRRKSPQTAQRRQYYEDTYEDAATGEHLPYITVVVKGTTIGTATDGTGHYFLKNLPAGEFVLEASMLGYGTVEKRVTTTSGKTIEVNFVLTEDSERMDEIVVTANRNETNKKRAPPS